MGETIEAFGNVSTGLEWVVLAYARPQGWPRKNLQKPSETFRNLRKVSESFMAREKLLNSMISQTLEFWRERSLKVELPSPGGVQGATVQQMAQSLGIIDVLGATMGATWVQRGRNIS
jgi:hypothetical protein